MLQSSKEERRKRFRPFRNEARKIAFCNLRCFLGLPPNWSREWRNCFRALTVLVRNTDTLTSRLGTLTAKRCLPTVAYLSHAGRAYPTANQHKERLMLLNLSIPLASMLASALLAVATVPAAPEPSTTSRVLAASPSGCTFCRPAISWNTGCSAACNPGVTFLGGFGTCNLVGGICGGRTNCTANVTVVWNPACGAPNSFIFLSAICATANGGIVPCPGPPVCLLCNGPGLRVTLACSLCF